MCISLNIAVEKLRLKYCGHTSAMTMRRLEEWVAVMLLTFVCANHPPEVLQGGFDLEDPPPSEHTAAVRRDNDKNSVRDGIRVDG